MEGLLQGWLQSRSRQSAKDEAARLVRIMNHGLHYSVYRGYKLDCRPGSKKKVADQAVMRR